MYIHERISLSKVLENSFTRDHTSVAHTEGINSSRDGLNFIENENEIIVRLVGHPYCTDRIGDLICLAKEQVDKQYDQQQQQQLLPKKSLRIQVAVGPEGGWTEEEMDVLTSFGFLPVTLGPRILKTYDALVSILALIYDSPSLLQA